MKRVSNFNTVIVAPLAVAAIILMLSFGVVRASVPVGTPTFSEPTVITNTYMPFEPGAMKVFRGHSGSTRDVAVDDYLTETRTFTFDGNEVECVILEETAFENGELVEVSRNFFAQADDGTMYYFGEVVDIYEAGVIVSHDGSWLVGGPDEDEGDPDETATATSPAVFMPANPEVGDVFKPEDLPPIVEETDEVLKGDIGIRVPAGRYDDVIKIQETLMEGDIENKWYAPGVGVIRARARGELLELIASTL